MEDSEASRVRFNVGGKRFETAKSTLDKAGPSSYFSCLLANRWNSNDTDETGWKKNDIDEIFIDRDPDYFGILLYMLRTGDLRLNKGICMDFLYKEARFYGLENQLRAAIRGDLDGERLRLARAVTVPYSMPEPVMIRASPTGAFCIANVDTLCSYTEWNIEEEHQNPLIHTDSPIYDVLWLDSWDIIVSTKKHIGLFNAASGELRHWFSEDSKSASDQPSVYSSKLCMNSNEIISSCTLESTGMLSAIALWDVETGKFKRSIPQSEVSNGGKVKKLQWINEINCLFVLCHNKGGLELSYIDVRVGENVLRRRFNITDGGILDVVADARNTTCLIHKGRGVWSIDNLKIEFESNWERTEPKLCSNHNTFEAESIYCHEGQLFACSRSEVLVLSSNRWVYTKIEGSIKDISIGGDRLFSLHTNPKVVRVWESPRCSFEY